MTKKKAFYETDSFKKLNDKWDQKLKRSGFQDIENDNERKNHLVSKQQITIDPARVVYFAKCRDWLNSHKFKNVIDEFIFEHHCEGYSNHEIADMLELYHLRPLHQSNVARRLLKLLKEAEIEPLAFKF